MGKIFYIMGKSASGKDRIYSLLAAHKELNLKTLILYTTRPIRAGEQDGKNYYFVDDGKLEEFRKNGNLIEERAYHTVYGIWTYFTADDGQVNLADSDYLGIGTLQLNHSDSNDVVDTSPTYKLLREREKRQIPDMRKCAEDLLRTSQISRRKIF